MTQEDGKKGENSKKDSDMSAVLQYFFSDVHPIKQKYSLICSLMKIVSERIPKKIYLYELN